MIRKLCIAALCTCMIGCTTNQISHVTNFSDSATTKYALSHGFVEKNVLLKHIGNSSAVAGASFIASEGYGMYLKHNKCKANKKAINILSSIKGGAAINNIAVIAHASNPALIGIAGAVAVYEYTSKLKR